MLRPRDLLQRRKERLRYKLRQINRGARPRLCVHRTNQHFYAQIVDDNNGLTIVSASTAEQDVRKSLKHGGNVAAAAEVGKAIAQKAKKKGVSAVVFDRSGYLYHGRIKAMADAARESGLEF